MKVNKVHFKAHMVFAAVAALIFLPGCSLWEKKEVPAVLVVDVLSRDLYDDCHIPGSIQVDFAYIMEEAQKQNWSKATKIVVYCANYACSASASAVRSLNDEGYDAVEYAAGMAGWFQAGYPVVGSAQSPYLTQENEPHAEYAADLPVISTEELKDLLDAQGRKEK